MTDNFETADNATAMIGELLEQVALDANGELFDGNDPNTWDAADQAPLEVISHGPVRFRIINAAAEDMASEAGVVEQGSAPRLCLHVEFEQADGAQQPLMGQHVTLPTGEDGVTLLFLVVITRGDLDDPAAPDLGPGAVHNEAFEALEAGQGLLVQVLDEAESNADEMEAA